MIIELVTVHEPNGQAHARVFVDGTETPANHHHIDTPGIGFTAQQWQQEHSSPAVAAARALYPQVSTSLLGA